MEHLLTREIQPGSAKRFARRGDACYDQEHSHHALKLSRGSFHFSLPFGERRCGPGLCASLLHDGVNPERPPQGGFFVPCARAREGFFGIRTRETRSVAGTFRTESYRTVTVRARSLSPLNKDPSDGYPRRPYSACHALQQPNHGRSHDRRLHLAL